MAALPLEPARAWLQTQGWVLSDYSITRSAIQSCPQGMVTLDCVWVVEGASKEERASRRRGKACGTVCHMDAIAVHRYMVPAFRSLRGMLS